MRSLLKLKYLLPLGVFASFTASYLVPGAGEDQTIRTVLAMVGILFAVIVGFFITDLYSRFEKVRENVSTEVGGLITYYSYVKILEKFDHHEPWVKKQRGIIDDYIKKFVQVEWHEYEKTDMEFQTILNSLQEVKELKTNKEVETYTNLLPVLSSISEARERLIIVGKDKLTKAEWIVILFLASTLIFSLFYLKEATFTSVVFTGALSSIVIVLVLILQDLSDLSFGEETVSFEPYEKVFDVIGKPRYYLKKDIKSGRVKPRAGLEYRTD